MSTQDERPATNEPDDMLARAAAEGPIAGIPHHEEDEPEPEETPTELSSEDEGDEFARFNIRG